MTSPYSLLICTLILTSVLARDQWTVSQANEWWAASGWFAGANFIPSTAVNTLEMWQAETYDPVTIDRELGWAADTGFKVMRVFLHHLVWQQNPQAFIARIDNYLTISTRHGIKTMLVMFDDCWNPFAHLGKQPAPRKGVHNSQWVQAPGENFYTDQSQFPIFQNYFSSIIGHFKDDSRIFLWDIYNEPGNSGHVLKTLPLLTLCFTWARDANPSQPISAGVWNYGADFKQLNDLQLGQSDVTTYHVYADVPSTRSITDSLKWTGRPLICTEYMARTIGSKFQTHIPVFHDLNVGAINWGLVSGKTNTIYPWGSPEGAEEPQIWFHDVFRATGVAFDYQEIEVIKKFTQQ